MKKCVEQIQLVAPYNTTVLLQGESGTGKEILAQYLHECSTRKDILSINCASLPLNLVESTLFGHEKGSFTGAVSSKVGYFERANNGTLFFYYHILNQYQIFFYYLID